MVQKYTSFYDFIEEHIIHQNKSCIDFVQKKKQKIKKKFTQTYEKITNEYFWIFFQKLHCLHTISI